MRSKHPELYRIAKLLRPLVEAGVVFVWIIYLVGVLRNQNYSGSLTFDLFLARVGGPIASHATTYLIFLSIFPIAYLMLRSIIPAFLIEVLAFDIHEGLWQIPYYIAWHSVIDWHVWLLENVPDTVATLVTVAALIVVYHFPARFFVFVTIAWGCFLSMWLALGFPVTVLSKLPNGQIVPSIYNTVLWVNQIEFLGWLYFASVLLICLRYFTARESNRVKARPSPDRIEPLQRGRSHNAIALTFTVSVATPPGIMTHASDQDPVWKRVAGEARALARPDAQINSGSGKTYFPLGRNREASSR